MFRLLINTVSGIGPKIALSILSGMSVSAIRTAVAQRDLKALSSISGVGKKTAERIVIELVDKVGVTSMASSTSPGLVVAPEAEPIPKTTITNWPTNSCRRISRKSAFTRNR